MVSHLNDPELNSNPTLLKPDVMVLGIKVGPAVTREMIFEPYLANAEGTLNRYHAFLSKINYPKRARVINTWITSKLGYPSRFFYMPWNMTKRYTERCRRVCTPLGGTAFPLASLIVPDDLLGAKVKLRSQWAINISLLASRSDHLDTGLRLFKDFPPIALQDSALIVEHRYMAAHDLFNYSRSFPDSTRFSANKQVRCEFQQSRHITIEDQSSSAIYRLLSRYGYERPHMYDRQEQIAARFNCEDHVRKSSWATSIPIICALLRIFLLTFPSIIFFLFRMV